MKLEVGDHSTHVLSFIHYAKTRLEGIPGSLPSLNQLTVTSSKLLEQRVRNKTFTKIL